MQIRPRIPADLPGCEALAALVHARDGYPPRYADDLGALFARPQPLAAWVATEGDAVVGHVALHDRSTAAAMTLAVTATGRSSSELVVLDRSSMSPRSSRPQFGCTSRWNGCDSEP